MGGKGWGVEPPANAFVGRFSPSPPFVSPSFALRNMLTTHITGCASFFFLFIGGRVEGRKTEKLFVSYNSLPSSSQLPHTRCLYLDRERGGKRDRKCGGKQKKKKKLWVRCISCSTSFVGFFFFFFGVCVCVPLEGVGELFYFIGRGEVRFTHCILVTSKDTLRGGEKNVISFPFLLRFHFFFFFWPSLVIFPTSVFSLRYFRGEAERGGWAEEKKKFVSSTPFL